MKLFPSPSQTRSFWVISSSAHLIKHGRHICMINSQSAQRYMGLMCWLYHRPCGDYRKISTFVRCMPTFRCLLFQRLQNIAPRTHGTRSRAWNRNADVTRSIISRLVLSLLSGQGAGTQSSVQDLGGQIMNVLWSNPNIGGGVVLRKREGNCEIK